MLPLKENLAAVADAAGPTKLDGLGLCLALTPLVCVSTIIGLTIKLTEPRWVLRVDPITIGDCGIPRASPSMRTFWLVLF
ncbi:MAG: hypothetical protein Aurels2KO_17560 [Aureliella sp.]